MEIPSEAEARVALNDIERARQRVVDEIGMPWWYWWGLAACWVGLGVMADLGVPWWATTIATVAVGAVHADGAGHPATLASVMMAIVVVLGGPQVMAWIRSSTS
jgi:hypothetical protein